MKRIGFITAAAGLALFILGVTNPSWSLNVEYQETKTISLSKMAKPTFSWNVTAFSIKNVGQLVEYCSKQPINCSDQDGKVPAMKLCFWKAQKTGQTCFRIEDPEASDRRYTYDTAGDLKLVRICTHCASTHGLLLEARNSGFDTGSISNISIWTYDQDQDSFVDALKGSIAFQIDEQGEYQVFSSRELEGVIVRAQAMIDYGEETRYSAHRFAIYIYKLNKKGKYEYIGSYKTKKKYRSLDDVETVSVIKPELRTIINFIKHRNKRGE